MTAVTEENLQRKSQWSIQDLMVCVAILSAFLAIAAYLGFNNGLLIICAVASGLLSCVFAATAPRGKFGCTTGATIVVLLLLCNPMLMFFSIVMAANCIGHWFLILLYKNKQPPITIRKALCASAMVALVAFSIGVAIGLPGYLEFTKEIKRFEPVDVAAKLHYESRFEGDEPGKIDLESSDSSDRYAELMFLMLEEKSDYFFGRRWALEGLHRRRAEQFVKSPGFGVARMFAPTIETASAPQLNIIEFHDKVELNHRHFRRQDHFSDSANAEEMHRVSIFDFVHPDGFGLKTEPGKYRGFLPHAFLQSPIDINSSYFGDLKLERLQLISLRRFDTPRAYDLDYLPRMDHLENDDVATRPLTKFELNAVKILKERTTQLPESEKDPSVSEIVLNQSEATFEMVGALRAMNSCLECHNAKRHELLGTFTYRFSKPVSARETVD